MSDSPIPDRSHADTKYGRLRDAIAQQIADGRLKPGEFLDSEPALARQFSIARGTVRQALGQLEQEGLVERIAGKGTVVLPTAAHHPPASEPQRARLSVFAIVLPELQTGHYPALVQSFDEAAGRYRHQTICCATGNDVYRQGDIVLQLIDKQVAGVALSPPTVGAPPAHHVRQLQQNGIPVVLLHRRIEGVSAPVLAIGYEKIARMAASTLLAHGHRRVAFIATHRSDATERYLHGFTSTLEASGLSLDPELVHYGRTPLGTTGAPSRERQEEVNTVLDRLLSLPEGHRPTAVFDPWDADAEAIYLAVTGRGLQVPDDFSIIGFGGAMRLGSLTARLTSITLNERDFATRAVELLEQMHSGVLPYQSDERLEVDVQLYRGETIKNAGGG